MEVNRIYCGDAFEQTKCIPAGSVDLVVTSPPYANQRKGTYGGVAPDRYVEWFLPLGAALYHALNPQGSFVLNIKENVVEGQRSDYVFRLVLALQQQGWLWTETYLWHKRNATPGKWPNRLRDAWEYCFHFTKQRKFAMYQDAVKIPVGDWAAKRMKSLSEHDWTRSISATGSGFGRNVSNWQGRDTVFPDNVVGGEDVAPHAWVTARVQQAINGQTSAETAAKDILTMFDATRVLDEEYGNVLHEAAVCNNKEHSAAFPETLPEFFIKLFTTKNDLVFDPFLGSGTTVKVARDLERRFLGFELKPEYFDKAVNRLKLEDLGEHFAFDAMI